MYALGALEGEPDRFRALLDPFHAMIEAQLARHAAEPNPRVRVPRPPRLLRERLPDELASRWDDLVCVVAEANAWPYRDVPDHVPDELVHWVAHRPATDETFDAIAAPTRPLSPSTSFHTRLSADELHAGTTRDALVEAYAAFARPTDVVCAWGHFGPRLFLAGGGHVPLPIVDVRAAAQRVARKKFGSLEDFAATIGSVPAPVGRGRAGQRAALLAQVLAAWRRGIEAGATA